MASKCGNEVEAIKDYSAVIDMPGAPAALKVVALWSRGGLLLNRGVVGKAVTDLVASLEDTPAEQCLSVGAMLVHIASGAESRDAEVHALRKMLLAVDWLSTEKRAAIQARFDACENASG